jgi:hypothetical protein
MASSTKLPLSVKQALRVMPSPRDHAMLGASSTCPHIPGISPCGRGRGFMRRILRCSAFFSVLAAALISHAKGDVTADAGGAEPPAAPADELLDRLSRVPGLSFVEEQLSPAPGFRFLILSFEQTLTLLHHSFDAPMVKFTTGYEIWLEPTRSEVTALVDGNQVGIEERFFSSSRPEPADYRDVDVYQAAADHHRVVEALESVYPGRWLSTGASKGGMATVYHRRFFEDDLDGSIAYVAPNDVVNDVDRYDEFFENVGTEACRESVWNVQRQALSMRDELAPWMAELMADTGCTLQAVPSADEAFELAVLFTDWSFWQGQTEADCPFVPGPDAYAYEVLDFVGATGLLWACDFAFAEPNFTYEYQAGTELGWPAREYPHLAGLLRYPGLESPRYRVPADIPMHFDASVMPDIDAWVRSEGSELMFIYGENDPWGAEPFELGEGSVDCYSYVAPGQNHGRADVATLVEAERLEAANTIRRWAGLPELGYDQKLVAPSGRPLPVLDALFANELDELRGAIREGRRL